MHIYTSILINAMIYILRICGVAPIELLPDRQLCTLLHIVVDHKVNSL